MKTIEFIKELPPARPGAQASSKWAELMDRPGEWAKFWGHKGAACTSAKHAGFTKGREGWKFESTIRQGEAYVRAVKLF